MSRTHYLVVHLRPSLINLGALSAERQQEVVFERARGGPAGALVCKTVRNPPVAPLQPWQPLVPPVPIDADFEVMGQLARGRSTFECMARYGGAVQMPVTRFCCAIKARPNPVSQVKWKRIQRALHAVTARVPGAVDMTHLFEVVPENRTVRILMIGERGHVGDEVRRSSLIESSGR